MTWRAGGEARPPMNIQIQSEINSNEAKRYAVRWREFHPNLTVRPVAGKFYARHDFPDPTLLDNSLVEAIRIKARAGPKERFKEPVTEAMEIGWYQNLDPLIRFDRTDRRLYHPKIGNWITEIGSIIAKEDEKHPKVPFTGIPFKL